MVDVTQAEYHLGRPPKSKGKTYPDEILTPDEVRTLLLACSETSSIGLRNRALLTMLYRTGMRISEALALHVKDLDLDRGFVAVLRGKGNRRRTVGIDYGAVWIIEAWIERRETLNLPNDAPLFCTLRGRTMRSSLVHSFLPRLARKVGIEKRVHPHGYPSHPCLRIESVAPEPDCGPPPRFERSWSPAVEIECAYVARSAEGLGPGCGSSRCRIGVPSVRFGVVFRSQLSPSDSTRPGSDKTPFSGERCSFCP